MTKASSICGPSIVAKEGYPLEAFLPLLAPSARTLQQNSLPASSVGLADNLLIVPRVRIITNLVHFQYWLQPAIE